MLGASCARFRATHSPNAFFSDSSSARSVCSSSSSWLIRVSWSVPPGAACSVDTGIAAASAAISGPRKVAALLFRNRRRIRIYDMEVEDDDEDEDDTLGTSGAGNLSNELNSSM